MSLGADDATSLVIDDEPSAPSAVDVEDVENVDSPVVINEKPSTLPIVIVDDDEPQTPKNVIPEDPGTPVDIIYVDSDSDDDCPPISQVAVTLITLVYKWCIGGNFSITFCVVSSVVLF